MFWWVWVLWCFLGNFGVFLGFQLCCWGNFGVKLGNLGKFDVYSRYWGILLIFGVLGGFWVFWFRCLALRRWVGVVWVV